MNVLITYGSFTVIILYGFIGGIYAAHQYPGYPRADYPQGYHAQPAPPDGYSHYLNGEASPQHIPPIQQHTMQPAQPMLPMARQTHAPTDYNEAYAQHPTAHASPFDPSVQQQPVPPMPPPMHGPPGAYDEAYAQHPTAHASPVYPSMQQQPVPPMPPPKRGTPGAYDGTRGHMPGPAALVTSPLGAASLMAGALAMGKNPLEAASSHVAGALAMGTSPFAALPFRKRQKKKPKSKKPKKYSKSSSSSSYSFSVSSKELDTYLINQNGGHYIPNDATKKAAKRQAKQWEKEMKRAAKLHTIPTMPYH